MILGNPGIDDVHVQVLWGLVKDLAGSPVFFLIYINLATVYGQQGVSNILCIYIAQVPPHELPFGCFFNVSRPIILLL